MFLLSRRPIRGIERDAPGAVDGAGAALRLVVERIGRGRDRRDALTTNILHVQRGCDSPTCTYPGRRERGRDDPQRSRRGRRRRDRHERVAQRVPRLGTAVVVTERPDHHAGQVLRVDELVLERQRLAVIDPALVMLRGGRVLVPGRLRGRVPEPAVRGEFRERILEQHRRHRRACRLGRARSRRDGGPVEPVVGHAHRQRRRRHEVEETAHCIADREVPESAPGQRRLRARIGATVVEVVLHQEQPLRRCGQLDVVLAPEFRGTGAEPEHRDDAEYSCIDADRRRLLQHSDDPGVCVMAGAEFDGAE